MKNPAAIKNPEPWLETVDHVTYVVRPDTIRKWAWWYIEVLGGKLTLKSDDANPGGKSSMKIWTVDFGKFSIALVAGIDREEKSHVTAFVERHGDHTVQHVAFRPRDEDFEAFLAHTEKYGTKFQGEPLMRKEGAGFVKQIFGWPYHSDSNPAEVGFDEIESRVDANSPITFSSKSAKELYEMAQARMADDERAPMVDWSRMPNNWAPPEVEQ